MNLYEKIAIGIMLLFSGIGFIIALNQNSYQDKYYLEYPGEVLSTPIPIENDNKVSILEESYINYKKKIKKADAGKNKQNKEVKEVKLSKKSVNKNDLFILAKLIYCEVGTIKDDRCLYLCGSVVLNRVNDKRYPNTINGVIFQPGQYEVTWNGAWNKKTPDKRSLKIAYDLLKKGTVDKRVMGMSERVWGKFHSRFDNVIFSIY